MKIRQCARETQKPLPIFIFTRRQTKPVIYRVNVCVCVLNQSACVLCAHHNITAQPPPPSTNNNSVRARAQRVWHTITLANGSVNTLSLRGPPSCLHPARTVHANRTERGIAFLPRADTCVLYVYRVYTRTHTSICNPFEGVCVCNVCEPDDSLRGGVRL